MSASSKKKLRKEQNAAALTERQKREQKEAKNLARTTVIFVVIMALIVTAGIGVLLRKPINTRINKNTHAISVGNQKINAVEFNYFYADAVQDFYNNIKETYESQASLYAQLYLGIDFSSPLDEQVYDVTTGMTWGDYFLQMAKANARSIYTLYNKAVAENYQVSADDQANIDITEMSMDFAAKSLGYSSTNAYVSAVYGLGADIETYKEYCKKNIIATSYFAAHRDSLTYTNDDYREYEVDKYNNFSCYTYATYTLSMNTYLTGGTPNENGGTTYSETERATALAAAKADADALLAGAFTSVEDLDKAIAALEINKDKKDAKSTQNKNTFFTKISNEDIKTWLCNPERKPGDMTIIEAKNTTTDAEGKETTTVTGYYVVYFQNERDNTMKLANVRHLLVEFKDGKKDDKGNLVKDDKGFTVYTDEQKAAAEKTAKELYEQWKNGEKVDEDSFIALVKEKSDDPGTKSTGGLLEDITPDDSLVENFLNWCFDNRTKGDHGIIESEYGYHIMYYVGDDEMSYRDTLIKEELVERDIEAWLTEMEKSNAVTDVDLSRVHYDYLPS